MDANLDGIEEKLPPEDAGQFETARIAKKKYEKPDITYRAPLEAMAATCSGAGGKGPVVCTVVQS